MKPGTARIVLTLILLAFVIAGVVVVNSYFGGSFWVGLLLIVLPFLLLAYVLPHLLPVRCPKCGARMRFKRGRLPAGKPDQPGESFGYVCTACPQKNLWEGASSDSSLD
jgi:hypothetical protein